MHVTHKQQLNKMTGLRFVLFALLSLVVVAALLPMGAGTAFPATSAEKQAEADEMVKQLDALQTQIADVTQQLNDATAAHDNAIQLMEEAQAKETAATDRTAELQKQLGERAVETYRNGSPSYLDVLFGSTSFSDFLISWDMVNRLNSYDAQLTSDSKEARKEAEAARQQYTEQERIASEKKDEITELKESLDQKSAEMSAEIERLTEEAAELLAKEEAEAEAARLAALAAADVSEGDITIIIGAGGLVNPLPGGVVTSTFGWRDFDNAFHMGLDLAAPTGTPVLAAAAGTVIIAGWGDGAGNWVVIAHGNGLVTKYMHASALYVSAGDSVVAGQVIMAVGSTGYSTGPHLHFQVEVNGTAVDPQAFI